MIDFVEKRKKCAANCDNPCFDLNEEMNGNEVVFGWGMGENMNRLNKSSPGVLFVDVDNEKVFNNNYNGQTTKLKMLIEGLRKDDGVLPVVLTSKIPPRDFNKFQQGKLFTFYKFLAFYLTRRRVYVRFRTFC